MQLRQLIMLTGERIVQYRDNPSQAWKSITMYQQTAPSKVRPVHKDGSYSGPEEDENDDN